MEKPLPVPISAGPHYFRLADASWIMIRSEYLNGATAKQIQRKWGVPPTTLYRHAYLGGWSKKSRADAFHEQVMAAHAASSPVGAQQSAEAAFTPPVPHAVDAAQGEDMPDESPAEVAARATAAAGRAIVAHRYQEAERLGRLAAAMHKLATPAKARGGWEDEEDPDPDFGSDSGDDRGCATKDCTRERCRLDAIRESMTARLIEIESWVGGDLELDVRAWAAMAEGIGMTVGDEDVAALVKALKAEGLADLD